MLNIEKHFMNKNKLKLVHDKLHQPLISTIKGNVKEKKNEILYIPRSLKSL